MTDYMTTKTVTREYNDEGLIAVEIEIMVYEELPLADDEPQGLPDVPLRAWPYGFAPNSVLPCKDSPNTTLPASVINFAEFKNRRLTDGYL